jgi:hypothetical protein
MMIATIIIFSEWEDIFKRCIQMTKATPTGIDRVFGTLFSKLPMYDMPNHIPIATIPMLHVLVCHYFCDEHSFITSFHSLCMFASTVVWACLFLYAGHLAQTCQVYCTSAVQRYAYFIVITLWLLQ